MAGKTSGEVAGVTGRRSAGLDSLLAAQCRPPTLGAAVRLEGAFLAADRALLLDRCSRQSDDLGALGTIGDKDRRHDSGR